MLVKDKHFEIVGVSHLDPNWAVRIMEGELEDVIVHFEKVALHPNTDTDTLELSFSYNIIVGHSIVAAVEDEELHNRLGELLAAVIETEIEEGTADLKERPVE